MLSATVTPGFSFTLPKSSLLNVGYSIGNRGRGNNALFVYYGITFLGLRANPGGRYALACYGP
jgi:hypothetical protein